MKNPEVFKNIQLNVLGQIESHREDIEEGRLVWFDVRVAWQRGEIKVTWSHQESGQDVATMGTIRLATKS